MLEKHSQHALKWIISVLISQKIPFQISGGLAARFYGAKRPIYDIDIDVPDKYFPKFLPIVKNYMIFGPERFRDETFDLLLVTLEYEKQLIDISGCSTDKIFNSQLNQWEPCHCNINSANIFNVYEIDVPVINKQDLINYKKKIRRTTDLEDIKAISQNE